jgi:hypothetical protein
MLLAMLSFWPALLGASPGQTSLQANVTVVPDTVYAGERVAMTILVRYGGEFPPGIELPDSALLRPFMLAGRRQFASRISPALAEVRTVLDLAVFGSGKQLLPAFLLVYRDQGGHVTGTQEYRPEASVFVKTLTPPGVQRLRPLKPPLQPEFPFLLAMPFVFAAFGLAGAVLLALFLVKRKVRFFAEAVDPAQVAGRKLRKLGSRLAGGMPPAECHAELSGILREYLERHYRIRALEAVTQEIERDLSRLGVSSFDTIMSLLRQADLVKFADSRPSSEESRSSIRQAEEIVRSGRNQGAP